MSIRRTNKLKQAVDIMNQIQTEKFQLFLERILTRLQKQQKKIFSDHEMKHLEGILGQDSSRITVLIQGSAFLFEQIVSLKLENEGLRRELLAIELGESCVHCFEAVWRELGAEYLSQLRHRFVSLPVIMSSFDWKLNLPLGSNHQQSPGLQAELKIALSDGKVFETQFSQSELREFYMKLELIQSQLDSLIQNSKMV